jgi:hypothetical protein
MPAKNPAGPGEAFYSNLPPVSCTGASRFRVTRCGFNRKRFSFMGNGISSMTFLLPCRPATGHIIKKPRLANCDCHHDSGFFLPFMTFS